MPVYCLKSVVVSYDDVFTVSACLIVNYTHLSGECGAYGVAYIYLYVQSLVPTAPTASEVACYDAARCRHAETAQVYPVDAWQWCCLVGVAVLPCGIEVG